MKETIENCEAFWIWIAKAGGEGKRIISVRPTDDGNAIEVTYADMKETYNPISSNSAKHERGKGKRTSK